jgi:phosphoglucosamine mutase
MTAPEKIRCMFGTDGVRDVANRGLMTPEAALSFGRAFVLFLTEQGAPRPKIVVCRDTRRSGAMLESALCSGMMSAGAEVYLLGVFPTPGISCVLRQGGFDAGAVISASHNPAEYNGIKFFSSRGYKLRDEDEVKIESYLGDDLLQDWRPTGASIGGLRDVNDRRRVYVEWLREILSSIICLDWSLVVDAANGAASGIVRDVFGGWGGPMSYCGVNPDGLNINDGVGVMHMDNLVSRVAKNASRLGMAFDGDADRVLMCDHRGRLIDGDIMLWVIARSLSAGGHLGSGLVATVMSNMALEEKLSETGIKLFRCPVGDRYVLEHMLENGALLGGEQSGHVIILDHVATGDGICTGLMFLKACAELGEDIDTLVDRFPRYPQMLENLKISDREAVLESPRLAEATRKAEEKLAGRGRVLLRPSGTEPLIRILVESRNSELTKEVCRDLKEAVLSIAG